MRVETDRRHTADAFGNPGLFVLATPALIWLIEAEAHRFLVRFLETGEGSVGTVVDVEHVAAAPLGTPVTIVTEVTAIDGRRITFGVLARDCDRVLMRGRHVRAVIDLVRYFTKLEALSRADGPINEWRPSE